MAERDESPGSAERRDRDPELPSQPGEHAPAADPHVPSRSDAVGHSAPSAETAEPTEGNEANPFAVNTYVPPEPEVHFAERRHRTAEEREQSQLRRARRRRRRHILGWAMLGAGVVIIAGTFWVGWRTYQAYSHLHNASAEVSTLQNQLKDITSVDPSATGQTVSRLQDEAAAAVSAVDDPIFRAATVIPVVGPNLAAVRNLTHTVDALATGVMPSLVGVAQTLQPGQLAPVDGAINLAPIQRISPVLQRADADVNAARQQLAAIDRSDIVRPIADAVLTLWDKLDRAAEVTGPAARISRLLPPLLGSSGPRTYLVVFQNPAELRATGGIFGSFAEISADHGRIAILDQGSASRKLGYFDPPVAELTKEQKSLYSPLLARFPQDVNLTPDFPTAAPLFAQMYRVRTGRSVDGVLAIDPVALSYMLKGAAPIDVGDGVKLTAKNLVAVLLSNAYKKFDGDPDQSRRDAFLANATSRVFTQVMSGHGDATALLDGLQRAASERRVLFYSADPTEQADIAGSTISGSLLQDPVQPAIGVFMNDGTAAKLGYYLSNEVALTEGSCRPDGSRELQVTVTMDYAPPQQLPAYVTGAAKAGRKLQTNVMVFSPTGGRVVSAQRDGAPLPLGHGIDRGREAGAATIVLGPAASTTLVFTVLTPTGGTVGSEITADLEVTPGVTTWGTSVAPYRVCKPATS